MLDCKLKKPSMLKNPKFSMGVHMFDFSLSVQYPNLFIAGYQDYFKGEIFSKDQALLKIKALGLLSDDNSRVIDCYRYGYESAVNQIYSLTNKLTAAQDALQSANQQALGYNTVWEIFKALDATK